METMETNCTQSTGKHVREERNREAVPIFLLDNKSLYFVLGEKIRRGEARKNVGAV